jgi:thiol-disulfide isomerase/thioredoxin
MNYKKIILACMCLCAMSLSAATGMADKHQSYAIGLQAPQLKEQTLYLGQYYMGKLYTQDSLKIDKKGKGVFTKSERLPQGMYVLYLKSGNYVDLLVGNDQNFTVKLDTVKMAENLRIEGAEQSEDFFAYTQFLQEKQKQMNDLTAQYKDSALTDKSKIEASMHLLSADVKVKQQELIQKYPDGMLGLFLKGLLVPELPQWTDSANCAKPDSCRSMHRYLFYKNHYLDNIRLSDVRTFRTPYIVNTLNTYFDKVLLQINDSIIPSALDVIEKSRGNDTTFQIVANHLLNYAVKSKIMGMDNLLVEIGKRYYLSGLATWADSTLKSNIEKEIYKIERSLIGMQAPNLVLADSTGAYNYLYNMGGEQITVLYFFEPGCGHCKKTTPVLAKFAQKYKDDPRIKIVAVYMLEDKEEWMKFVKEHDMSALVNVWDPKRVSNYWYWYDTSTTPMMYVMDKEHTLFAKKIDVETLERIAQYELK